MKTYLTTKTGYLASNAVVAALAKDYAQGVGTTETARGTYLRILVAHSQKELADAKRVTTEAALAAVQSVHERLYGIVLDAITTPDIAPDAEADAEDRRYRTRERNRRSNFARSSKSVLSRWIEQGGRLVTLDPAEVTKDKLAIRAGPQPTIQRVARVEEQLQKLIAQLAEEDPGAAEEAVAEMQRRMSEALGAQPAAPLQPTRQVAKGRRRVGELTLNPH